MIPVRLSVRNFLCYREDVPAGRLPIADGLEAFERARKPGVLKILLDLAEG